MTDAVTALERWMKLNANRFIDCRWGCKITVDACHAYQSRTSRYILHFNGERTPSPRVNAEYLKCFFPEPCPNFLSDEEAGAAREKRDLVNRPFQRPVKQNLGRELNRLISPDEMLREAHWHRSLVAV